LLVAGAVIAAAVSPGVITEFSTGLNAGSAPADIVSGPDGNLWFTDAGSTKAIGRVTPSGGITEFSTGLNPGSSPEVLVSGPDGNLWFTDAGSTKAIGQITSNGTVTQPPTTGVSGTTTGTSGTGSVTSTCSVSLASERITEKKGVAAVKLIYAGSAHTCGGRLTLTVKTTTKKGNKKLSRTVQIATSNFSIRSGKTMTVKLKFNAPGRALLSAHHGHLSARLTILKSSPVPPKTKTESVSIVPQKTAKAKAKAKKPKK
jgi:hypothetical protein